MKRQGFLEPAGGVVRLGQVVHAHQRVGMIGAKLGLTELERVFVQQHSFLEPAGVAVRQSQVVHAGQRVRMVGAVLGLPQFKGLLMLGDCELKFSQIPISHANRMANRRLDERLILEHFCNLRLGRIYGRADGGLNSQAARLS